MRRIDAPSPSRLRRAHGAATACAVAIALAIPLVLAGCDARQGAHDPTAIRLVDRFAGAALFGTVAPAGAAAAKLPRTEWTFASIGATASDLGWRAGPDVAGFAIRDGLLVGETTGPFPLLHIERTQGLDNLDQVHAVEIRLRVSAGANVKLTTSAGERIDLASLKSQNERPAWPLASPLEPGSEMRTYTLLPLFPLQGARIRHLVVRPTDVAGASFAIESIRLIFRKEQLASVPSGIGWQGLRDVFRETIVARSGESVRFEVELPERAWLDLGVGTIEESPLAFAVRVERLDGGSAAPALDLRRTVTLPYRWEPWSIDLAAHAGERVALTLAILSADAANPAHAGGGPALGGPGSIGFWGSPAVRSRAARGAAGAARERPAPRPNGVILVQADTLRRDHLDAYGHGRPTAPTIARMAAEGTLFRHAFSQAPWTKASTPSILSSLYPSTHGVKVFVDRLPASATTIAEVYRDAGYATLALCSVPFVGQYTNLHQGFEELHESASLAERTGPLSAKTAREHVDRLLAWLERHREAPFFVFLHVFDPHSPYEPYRPYNTLWVDPPTREAHLVRRAAVTPGIADEFMRARQLPRKDEVERAGFDPQSYIDVELAWYDASIRAMDVELARLLERLADWGIDDDTLVALTSDHGTEFFDHGRMFHGHSLHGELNSVPLVVRWPRAVAAGRAIDNPVQSIDIAPTLLAASGLERPEGFQGQSLWPLLGPEARSGADGSWPGWRDRPVVSERFPSAPNQPSPDDRTSHALLEGDWKLIHHRDPPGLADELYAWRSDPLDQKDVAADHPEVVARLRELLARWRADAEAARLPPDAAAAAALSAEETARLRSLGYIR